MKNKRFLPLALFLFSGALVISGMTIARITPVLAESNDPEPSSIIRKLVQRFGLKESEVESVFSEAREEKQKQMQERFEQRLDQAVQEGKLTEAQKQVVLIKHRELQTKVQNKPANWYNMTPEEKKSFMQKQRQDLETWAKDNNLDLSLIMPLGGFGKQGHMGGFKGNCRVK
jgi:UDP-N-acetylglucosamine pyrophosphorylase